MRSIAAIGRGGGGEAEGAEVDEGVEEAGVHLKGAAEIGFGGVALAEAEEGDAAVIDGGGVVGVEGEGLTERGKSVLAAAGLEVDFSQFGEDGGIVRSEGEGLLKDFEGGGRGQLAGELDAWADPERVEMNGFAPQGGAVPPEGDLAEGDQREEGEDG